MKKALLSLLTLFAVAGIFISCDNPALNKIAEQIVAEKNVTSVWNHAWFAGDAEYQFIDDGTTKYIRYLPDTLTDTYYLEVKSVVESSNTVNAVVKYSKDSIREMGLPVKFTYSLANDRLTITADDSTAAKFKTAFTAKTMVSYQGVGVAKLNIPAVQTVYFSNMQGTYTLNTSGWKLQVAAKVSLEKNVSNYWFAHVVDLKEENGTYDFLLCHDSNADPGVTGSAEKEPFINSQNTVWSRMKISPDGDKSKVEWSSQWYQYPYDALNGELDKTDTINYVIEEIHYVYKFYFAVPGKDSSGWCCVNKTGDVLATIDYTTHIPTDKTWSQIYEEVKTQITIPDDKTVDYWWYSTNSVTSIESSYVYKLSDSYKPSLKEYEFYCALKDKPVAGQIYYQEGTFERTDGTSNLTVTSTGLTYNSKSYTYVAGAAWTNATDGVNPLQYCYLLTDGEKKYFAMIEWYTNNGKTYVNFREPKETSSEALSAEKTESGYVVFGSRKTTLNKK